VSTGKTFHRSENIPVDVGEDIFLYDGDDPSVIATFGSRTKFLNALWLPCVLSQLTPSQIVLVNRFREFRLIRDNQFRHAKTARELMVDFIHMTQPKSLLEVGCGKFPIVSDIVVERYRGIEIDDEAIQYCRSNGVDVGTLDIFFAETIIDFDLTVALYAFHFSISTSLIEYLVRNMTMSSCLVFNVIADDATSVLNTLVQLSRNFPVSRIFKSSILAKREFFVIMSRSMISRESAILERLLNSAGAA
jgi:hypothetical protein